MLYVWACSRWSLGVFKMETFCALRKNGEVLRISEHIEFYSL